MAETETETEPKVSKGSVNYRPGGANERCEKCDMFEPPNACEHVEGRISPIGTCDDFEPKGNDEDKPAIAIIIKPGEEND